MLRASGHGRPVGVLNGNGSESRKRIMSDSKRIQEWPKLRSESGPALRLFRIRFDHRESPRTGGSVKALVLETPDWANIVALTKDGDLVMVRQYRFGVEKITMEIPGRHGGSGRRSIAGRETRAARGNRIRVRRLGWARCGGTQSCVP